MRFSKLAALGVLLSMLGAAAEESEKKYISMEEITAEMKLKFGEEILEGDEAGGLRKLQCQPWSCEHGSNPDLVMTFAGRKWGSKCSSRSSTVLKILCFSCTHHAMSLCRLL